MKTVLLILAILALDSVAVASTKTLKCDIIYRYQDANGKAQTEKHKVAEQILHSGPGFYSVGADVNTNDGRFQIQCFGIQGKTNPAILKSSILVYDSQSRSGAQAGGMTLTLPASSKSEINYGFNLKNSKDASMENLITAQCDIE